MDKPEIVNLSWNDVGNVFISETNPTTQYIRADVVDENNEQINELSEILLGCREGSLSECITEANRLKTISKKYQQNDQVELLFMQIYSLHETMLDIEAEA